MRIIRMRVCLRIRWRSPAAAGSPNGNHRPPAGPRPRRRNEREADRGRGEEAAELQTGRKQSSGTQPSPTMDPRWSRASLVRASSDHPGERPRCSLS